MNRENGSKLPDCDKYKLGSCRSCNMMMTIIHLVRYGGRSPATAREEVKSQSCPEGAYPDNPIHYKNEWASFGMGQRREENFDDLPDRKPLFPRPSKGKSGRKLSKTPRNYRKKPRLRSISGGWYQSE